MKIERRADAFVIEADQDELLIINNALNEICHGVDIPAFELRIGASRDQVATVLRVVGDALEWRQVN